VIQVAPRQLNVFRALYVIGDVLAHRGRDQRVICVLNHEGRHADRREHRPHVHLSHQRRYESVGSWARRKPIMSRARRADLFVPWHVGIYRMPVFTGSPHGDMVSEDFLGIDVISAFTNRIGVALQHHERGGA
jgi:hypothetical protein